MGKKKHYHRVDREITKKRAFEWYYQMGDVRTYQKLHDEHLEDLPSVRTLKTWASEDDWRERVQIRDREVARALQETAIGDSVAARAKYLKLIDALIGTAISQTESGHITLNFQCDNIKDLKMLIDTAWKLRGEPEHIEHEGEIRIVYEAEVIEGAAGK